MFIFFGWMKTIRYHLGSERLIDYVLIDGNMRMENIQPPCESIVKGDNKSLSIAAGADYVFGRTWEIQDEDGGKLHDVDIDAAFSPVVNVVWKF